MGSGFHRTARRQAFKRIRHRVHVPYYALALVRSNEIWLTVLSSCVGIFAGLSVWLMTRATLLAHRLLYDLHNDGRLSGLDRLDPWRTVLMPCLGGLALGMFGLIVARRYRHRPVDPIEANALHGGRMSVRDSAIVAFQTFMSNGCGASLGLEAGFSQIAAALGSRCGALFRVRRADMRILVGCGAGGAIGAAFDAPLAGAFYAFELVIGTYSLVNLAPVAIASISAVGVVRLLGGVTATVTMLPHAALGMRDSLPVMLLGVTCGLAGIAVMYGVTFAEGLFRRLSLPGWVRPGLGGVMVGGLALYSPSILSAGHAAVRKVLVEGLPVSTLVILLVFKAVASSISIGSGFRGGLFFASLFLGVLSGSIFGHGLTALFPAALSVTTCAILGMSATAVAIIGVPMTMTCLILEMTADLSLASGVLLASVMSLLTVRRLFGYSFATWRFHQRGESIRSAIDISWLRELTVGRMMRHEMTCFTPDTLLGQARQCCPLGATPQIVLVDASGTYRGIVLLSEIHAPDHPDDRMLGDLALHQDMTLLPEMTCREAAAFFEQAEADALVVIADRLSRRVVGLLSEKYVLRRYAEALDRTRRELTGEVRGQ
ncbi:CIC family chloride channel protein [Asaia bogorensis NBRC 16594]|nr:CIC family chloride channel protein [Asaia bogorensis NBRC 16594]